ncbi:nuclear transport factor 2 family protein [Pseudomonas cichorii]|uniref:nuclear transport factor 2 family protein n=1 Tax=Pseudomonas cichorii TaxID=36746 RepID=UPI001C8A225D|nr:nuclear transport factor 2 family protein [Pseudomonas cichorii]MBX8485258.1 ester cyclase [Pseudomonas cichorii]
MSTCQRNIETLRAIYEDLTRIAEFADDDIVLHKADRNACPSTAIGKQAVRSHEVELIAMTHSSLHMDVQEIIANEYFGTVLGNLRATSADKSICMPFCGLWRFREGKVIEHWENAYDVGAFAGFLMGDDARAARWLCV